MSRTESSSLPPRTLSSARLGGLAEVLRYRELLRHLVGRELKVKYKRSALGWLWSLANPLVVAAVFTLVFSFFLRVPPPEGNPSGLTSYGLFFLAGLLCWNFTSNGLSFGTASIVGGADLVKKVYFPREILPISQVTALVVTFFVEILVLLGLVLAVGGSPWGGVVALPVLMAMQYLFVAGVAMLVAALNVFFRDLQHLIGIVLLVWFYATPIIYPFDLIPASVELAGYDIPARTLMGLNPMARFVEAYRDALYHGRLPSMETAVFLFVVSILVFAASYLAFRRLAPRFAEEV